MRLDLQLRNVKKIIFINIIISLINACMLLWLPGSKHCKLFHHPLTEPCTFTRPFMPNTQHTTLDHSSVHRACKSYVSTPSKLACKSVYTWGPKRTQANQPIVSVNFIWSEQKYIHVMYYWSEEIKSRIKCFYKPKLLISPIHMIQCWLFERLFEQNCEIKWNKMATDIFESFCMVRCTKYHETIEQISKLEMVPGNNMILMARQLLMVIWKVD